MNRLGLITSLGAVLALPACIVEHGLGETAEGSEGSDESEHGTGSGTESPPDPSATSGQPPTATSTSATSGGTDEPPDPSGATDDDPTATDGDPTCDQGSGYARWVSNGASFSPLAGIDASFVAILTGDCTVGEIVEIPGMEGDPTWTIPLQCSLSGRIDGDPMVVGDFSPVIQMTGSLSAAEVTASIPDQVRLSVVLDWWGMGWNAWLVLEGSEGAPVLDLIEAEYVDPTRSTWGLEVAELLGDESWHKGLQVGTTESECGGPVTKCGEEPMAITVGWIEESPLVLHPYQDGTVGTPFEELQIHASVTAASMTPVPTCLDMPLAYYAMAAWAVTP